MAKNGEKQQLERYAQYLEGLLRDNGIGFMVYRMETGGDYDVPLDMDPEWRLIHQRIQDAKESLDAKGIPFDENPPDEGERM